MIRVMLVDDEKIVLDGLTRLLQEYDFEIHYARNGKEGLEVYEQVKPDLIITDISMPGMTGTEMLQVIRETDEQVLAIILSAFDQFEYTKKSIQFNVFDYILKPIGKKKLTQSIDKALLELKKNRQKKSMSHEHEKIMMQSRDRIVKSFFDDLMHNQLDQTFYSDFFGFNYLNPVVVAISMSQDSVDEVHNYLEDYNPIIQVYNQKAVLYFDDLIQPDILLKRLERNFHLDQILYVKGLASVNLYMMMTRLELVDGVMEYKDQPVEDNLSELVQLFVQDLIEKMSFDTDLLQLIESNYSDSHRQDLMELYYQSLYVARKNAWATGDVMIDWLNPDVLHQVMDRLKSWQHKTHQLAVDTFSEITRMALEIVDDRYLETLTLEELADEIAVSSPYLSKIFKSDTGYSFKEYVTMKRVDYAKECLLEGKSVSETSDLVGYNDSNYFIRIFKKTVGMTPKEFQKERL